MFRAFEPEQERLIAVKAFRLDIVPEVTVTLAEALRRIADTPVDSECVVPAVGAGLQGMTAYMASEYVTAETLDVALRRMGPLPLDDALPILRQVADAIDAAWRVGIGHGALHPRDIFVAPDTQRVRVSGFGIIAALEGSGVKVTPRRPYTAPERIANLAWDMRADVFSLGVLAHELLTGRRPSGAGDQDGTLPAATTAGQRVAIRRALAGVLVEDPEGRYPTPAAFIAALETGAAPAQQALFGAVDDDVDAHDQEGEWTAPAFMAPVSSVPAEAPMSRHEVELAAGPHEFEIDGDDQIYQVDQMNQVDQTDQTDQINQIDQLDPTEPVDDPADRLHSTGMRSEPDISPVTLDASRLSGGLIALVVVLMVGSGMFGYWLRGWSPEVRRATAPVTVVADAPEVIEPPVTAPALSSEIAEASPVPTALPSAAPEPSADAAPTPPPSAPSATPARGRLLVRSVPAGARVVISGRSRGTTPATVRDLPYGTYNVTVSRNGYRTRAARVTLSKNQPARDITLELRPIAPPPAAATVGAVYIDTRPAGARVTIDGRRVGTAPMRVPNLAPGSHTIRLELSGHKSVTTTVVVRAGQQVPVRVSLEVLSDGGS